MSESTGWVLFAFVSAVILSALWVRWRAHLKESRVAAAGPNLNPSAPSDQLPNLWRKFFDIPNRRPLLVALVALGLASLAQYALLHGQTSTAFVGYIIGTVLFVAALRRFTPVDFGGTITPVAPSMDNIGPEQSTVVISKLAARFWTHWRYYTVADLIRGRNPSIPSSTITAVAPQIDSQTTPIQPSVKPTQPMPTVSFDTATVLPAQVATWTGGATPFVKPQCLLVTHQGYIIVLDNGQNLIYQLDPSGHVLGLWAVPSLPATSTLAVAMSADGNTLYIADPQNRCVHVITLGTKPE